MLVVRVQAHPDALLASAHGGAFHGGYVATLGDDSEPLPPSQPPPAAGGTDDLHVGCGRTVDEAIEDLALWLSQLARHTAPEARDRDPLARGIRAAQLVDRATLVASLHERVQHVSLPERRRAHRAA